MYSPILPAGGVRRLRAGSVVAATLLLLIAHGPTGWAADNESTDKLWPIMPTSQRVVDVPLPSPVGDLVNCLDGSTRRVVAQPVYPPDVGDADNKHVYVALGDSYAAGEGAPVTVEDSCGDPHQLFIAGTSDPGNHCHRSPYAYPVKLWEQLGPAWSLDHRACSGATTEEFENQQKFDDAPFWKFWDKHDENANPPQWAVDPNRGKPSIDTTRQADLVTITMAGNDLHFANIVEDCVRYATEVAGDNRAHRWIDRTSRKLLPDFLTDHFRGCSEKWDHIINPELKQLVERLTGTFTSARQNLNPSGRLIVTGYPRPFPDDPPSSCGVGVGFRLAEGNMRWLNTVADRANNSVREAARRAEASYVDVSNLYSIDGQRHDACIDDGSQRWINRTIFEHMEWSWHPKSAAHQAEAQLIIACYRNAQICNPTLPASGDRSVNRIDEWPIVAGTTLPEAGPLIDEPYVRYAFDTMGCALPDGGPGLGILLNDAAFGDVTGDGVEDAVITLECQPSTSGWPETVLVLDGNNGKKMAPIAGVLIDSTRAPTILDATAFNIPGDGTITVRGTDNHSASSSAHDDAEFAQEFTWNGSSFIAGPRSLKWFSNTEEGPCPIEAAKSIPETAGLAGRYETSKSVIYICAGKSGLLYYYGLTNSGSIMLPAGVFGDSIFYATNQANGHIYTYTVNWRELVITKDGQELSRQPVDPLR